MSERRHPNLLGKPHYELLDRYGYQEALLDRYESQAEAEAAKTTREQIHWHAGELVVRPRDF